MVEDSNLPENIREKFAYAHKLRPECTNTATTWDKPSQEPNFPFFSCPFNVYLESV